ncbi:ABC transporter substrate-binding protein [Bremerella sp.]|uniref:ABC transporter substrate-binding protein n=1 Tax=Bremerella sp. TaxID=2795602 RepID=UPI00391A8325
MGLRSLVLGLVCVLTVGSVANATDGIGPSEIHLGQACATKGPAKALGRGMRSGLEVYFQQLNQQGGIDGRQIKLTTINDGYEPKKSEMATRMLIEKKDIFLMIGGVGTPTAKVTVPVCEEHQVPFIAPFTGAEFLRNPYRRYVINLRGSYFQEMELLAEYLVDKQGLKRIACFYQNDGYGQAGLAGIVGALERRNMQLIGTGTYERNTVAIATGLNEIAKQKPDAVVMVGANMPCAMFIKQAKKHADFDKTLFCNISFVGTEALLANLGDASEGCIVSQVVPFPWDTSIPVVSEFQRAMQNAGRSEEIGFVSLEGYLAGKLFHEVAKRVDGELTRESFIDAVDASGAIDLGGITVTFGSDDHQGMDEVFLTQFKDGQVVRLEN